VASNRRLLTLVDQQASRRAGILNQLIVLLQRLMGRVDWYNEKQVQAFAAQAAQLTRSAQVATGNLTSAYLTRVLAEMDVKIRASTPALRTDLRGVPQETVWERPAKEYRYLRSTGLDDADAQERASRRAVLIADDDVTLAMRTASRDVLSRVARVTGYRRVIHPELSTGGTCGLCIVASDRIYAKDVLLDIHERCHCEVLPIVGADDPGNSLNGVSLTDLYADADGNTRDKLKATRYQVQEHGELGQVLRTEGDSFRDEESATADLRNAS